MEEGRGRSSKVSGTRLVLGFAYSGDLKISQTMEHASGINWRTYTGNIVHCHFDNHLGHRYGQLGGQTSVREGEMEVKAKGRRRLWRREGKVRGMGRPEISRRMKWAKLALGRERGTWPMYDMYCTISLDTREVLLAKSSLLSDYSKGFAMVCSRM